MILACHFFSLLMNVLGGEKDRSMAAIQWDICWCDELLLVA